MADAKLTALTAASALAAADLFYVSQSAASRKATGTQLLALVGTTYVPLAGGTMTGALTIASGTLTASAPALSVTQTWTTGASFTGALMNITDTSSTAGSLLQDWQVGGVSKLNIKKDGALTWGSNARIESDTAQIYITHVGSGRTWASFRGYTTGLTFNTESGVVWCSSTNATAGTQDLFLVRDAAATLAQRNGTTQQIFRLYNTYTDSSNYERLTLTGVAGTSVNITAETLGTGGDNLNIILTPAGTGRTRFEGTAHATVGMVFGSSTAGLGATINFYNYGMRISSTGELGWTAGAMDGTFDTAFLRGAAGQVDVTNGTAATYRDLKLRNLLNVEYHQMTEMTAPSAPATNSVRIYAEDNGAGKTRLMALFATGSAVQLGIEP